MTKETRERKIAGTASDPTLPKTPVEIGGKTYNLCFDLGALAEAETAINAELARAGRTDFVNLLFALPRLNLANVRTIFAAAVRKFHPKLSFDEACAMVDLNSAWDIATAVKGAWEAAQPAAEADPPAPQAQK